MTTFIVKIFSAIFLGLKWISCKEILFRLILRRKVFYASVEIYALTTFIISFISLVVLSFCQSHPLQIFIILLAGISIFEILVAQINILLFDHYRALEKGRQYALRSYRRIIILLVINYFEIITWFATIYRIFNYLFESKSISLDTIISSLYFSIQTITTLGYGEIHPNSLMGCGLVSLQTIIGLFMALMMISRFINLIPTPGTKDKLENIVLRSEGEEGGEKK